MQRNEIMSTSGRGFVLIEAMVVFAIIVVLAVFVVPAFGDWRMRDRVAARAQALAGALSLARDEAVTRLARVTLCRSDGAGRCALPGIRCTAGASDWSCGWLVFAHRTAGEPILLRAEAAMIDVPIAGPATSMTFVPPAGVTAGSFRSFELGPQEGSLRRGGAWSRCIRIAAGGRVRVTEGSCSGSAA